MCDRYFVEQPIQGDRAVLAGPEAHHLIHVMRAAPGLHVILFDGNGAEFSAIVERISRSDVRLSILSRCEVDREPPLQLTLAVGLPKGDRQRWLVEKAVELGVARIVPLITQRTVAEPVEQALRRLRRAVIEASKQCGRNRLMEIAEPQSWLQFLQSTAAEPHRLLAHPQSTPHAPREGLVRRALPTEQRDVTANTQQNTTVGSAHPPKSSSVAAVLGAIGPEGGFTNEEVGLAIGAGWQTIDLGPRILRVETAALLMAGFLISSMQDSFQV